MARRSESKVWVLRSDDGRYLSSVRTYDLTDDVYAAYYRETKKQAQGAAWQAARFGRLDVELHPVPVLRSVTVRLKEMG